MNRIDTQETNATQARYDRIAPIYDVMETMAEWRYTDWRERVWSLIEGPEVLEVGVGTGKNLPYHPPDVRVTGIDLSAKMLARARRKARAGGYDVELRQMDAQDLDFADDIFDSAAATFVFCSVPDPVQGLREMNRVVEPGGRIVLLEHVRSDIPILGALMDIFDPVTARLMGPHINRRTVENVRDAGIQIERVDDLGAGDIFKLIVARAA